MRNRTWGTIMRVGLSKWSRKERWGRWRMNDSDDWVLSRTSHVLLFNYDQTNLSKLWEDWQEREKDSIMSRINLFHQSRATSTTRTVFRLNTNRGHAYEETTIILIPIYLNIHYNSKQTYCMNPFQHVTSD